SWNCRCASSECEPKPHSISLSARPPRLSSTYTNVGSSTEATSARSDDGSSRQRDSFRRPFCLTTTVSTCPESFANTFSPTSGANSSAATHDVVTSPGVKPTARNGASYRDTISRGAITTTTSTCLPPPACTQ